MQRQTSDVLASIPLCEYVIGADGTLHEEIRSERDMDVHADRALEVLVAR